MNYLFDVGDTVCSAVNNHIEYEITSRKNRHGSNVYSVRSKHNGNCFNGTFYGEHHLLLVHTEAQVEAHKIDDDFIEL